MDGPGKKEKKGWTLMVGAKHALSVLCSVRLERHGIRSRVEENKRHFLE